MQLFECQGCNAALHFENSQCLNCRRQVGFLQDRFVMSALEGGPQSYQALAAKQPYRYCDNAQYGVCNWLIPEGSAERLCEACRHNHIIPDLSVPQNVERWGKIELAKRYLFRSILRWGLPHPNKVDDPEHGLAFDFLSDEAAGAGPILTGHDNGLITLNIAEGDDAEREKRRATLGEPYRTLVGHFRHEIGHYYWDMLVKDSAELDGFRAVFGDESIDYGDSLKRHYGGGPPPDWSLYFISSYASAHPWEDFAETWAHYLHIVDALETARSYSIDVRARFIPNAGSSKIDFHPYSAPNAERLIDAWVPLTVALNGVNRSMGHADLYPFVLNESVMKKLQFVHELIAGVRQAKAQPATKPAAA